MPSLTFRTTDVTKWGTGKGSILTKEEGDSNIWYLYSLITALQEHLSTGVSIASITQTAPDQITITMTDDTVAGPFTLPTSDLNPTTPSTWTAGKVYYARDVFNAGGALYVVNYGHTAGSSFDPNAVSGSHVLYKLLLPAAQTATPQIMDVSQWTPGIADVNTYTKMMNPSGTIVYIEPESVFDADVGTELSFRQGSTGTITFDAISPAYIEPQDGCVLITSGQGATCTLKKVDTDYWDAFGRFQLV